MLCTQIWEFQPVSMALVFQSQPKRPFDLFRQSSTDVAKEEVHGGYWIPGGNRPCG